MKKYNNGRAYEYKLKKELEQDGAVVVRASGSHSPFDLVAIYPEGTILYQVKKTSLKKAYFKQEIKQMQKIKTTCAKRLAIWHNRKGWEFIEVE